MTREFLPGVPGDLLGPDLEGAKSFGAIFSGLALVSLEVVTFLR